MAEWRFLTNHARALLYFADQPDARLRYLAAAGEVTARAAVGVVVALTEAGYVVKERDGRRNRYQIQDHVPLSDRLSRERTIGELLTLLGNPKRRPKKTTRGSSSA